MVVDCTTLVVVRCNELTIPEDVGKSDRYNDFVMKYQEVTLKDEHN
ncbi:MAG: hypothetical protein KME21_18995 [Desmonostoc vinosum HA7617-LM4]|jgi:hypothetical protein|nr:hypothetical protein [Desmonostoc vinosum HA7617-LM4]